MRDKSIFVYKPFLSLNISNFSLFFMEKLHPPSPWKKSPMSSPATTLWDPEIWGLRSCQAPPFWKFSRGLNPPLPPHPQQKGRRGAHYEFCLNLNMMTQLTRAPLCKSWKICHEIDAYKWSRKDCVVAFTFTSHKSHRWQHHHLVVFHIFIFHVRCMQRGAV